MTEVLTAPFHGASYFDSDSLRSSSHSDLSSIDRVVLYSSPTATKTTYSHAEFERSNPESTPSSAPESPQYTYSTCSERASYASTPASSLSLDYKGALDDGDDIIFPSYDDSGSYSRPSHNIIEEEAPIPPVNSPRGDAPHSNVSDDQDIQQEPTRHVDYLSHNWKEEDIWSSWRYVVARRKSITNSVRLENASWRTWMKAKYNLKTISPETLNWLKDCDVTWLYGPLQSDTKKSFSTCNSMPPSRLSQSSSFVGTTKKPILKKKSASAVILEKSRSSNSLLKQAGALLRAQQASPANGRPAFGRSNTDFSLAAFTGSSHLNTPAELDTNTLPSARPSFLFNELQPPPEIRHVNFDNEVIQCIAIESDDDEEKEEVHSVFSEDEDDDGGLMMRPSPPRGSNRTTPRSSFGADVAAKMIAPLPSSTLKYRENTPEPDPEQQLRLQGGIWPLGKGLVPSPSQETLRPSRPNQNFLIDNDEDEYDMQWQPSTSSLGAASPYEDEEYNPGPGMRRTPSGMFMPYDESEEEAIMNNTVFGSAVNAINTVRDMAYVVWNVGWGK